MAELFLARAEGLGGFTKLVAVKRILPHHAANDRFVRMFLAEAKLVATLSHPNIAQVYDIGLDDNSYFFAMEHVHGQDLRHVLQRVRGQGLSLEHALHIAIGVCSGLHYAHEARDPAGVSLGIVHRDVSPSNVLVSYEGAVKLVDFGVAKAASIVSETKEGALKGKYGYMSPEQCLGGQVDRRSDVFAIGILLWECTLGRRLYKQNGELATLQRIVYADATPPSKVRPDYPPQLEAIVMRALARNVNHRYQTAQEVQIDLERFAHEHRIAISAISTGNEMQHLFEDRIEAWHEAQQAGRSLADHLAEPRSSDSHSAESSDGEEVADVVDGVIGDLDTSVFAHPYAEVDTKTERPPGARPSGPLKAPVPRRTGTEQPAEVTSPAQTATPPRTVTAARAHRRSSRVVPLLMMGTLLLVIGGLWLVFRTGHGSNDAAQGIDAAAIAAADPDPTVPDRAGATVADPEDAQEIAAEPDAISGEPAGPDAGTTQTPAPDRDRDRDPDRDPDRDRDRHSHSRDSNGKHDPKNTSGSTTTNTGDLDDPGVDDPGNTPDIKPDLKPGGGSGSAIKPKGPVIPDSLKRPATGDAAKTPKPGTVDAKQVRAVVRSHMGAIESCVERGRMENRDLAGKVVIRIKLSGTGQVTGASVGSSTIDNASVESCMTKAVSGWTFPAPAGGVAAVITYPFSI